MRLTPNRSYVMGIENKYDCLPLEPFSSHLISEKAFWQMDPLNKRYDSLRKNTGGVLRARFQRKSNRYFYML